MSENVIKTFEYHRGYSNGFKEGYDKALEHFEDQIYNKPIQIIINSKEELLEKTCKNKCYLYNKKYCSPDGLVLFDATTCKNYHTEESYNAYVNLLIERFRNDTKY